MQSAQYQAGDNFNQERYRYDTRYAYVASEKGAPKAYVRYVLYDADSNYVSSGYQVVSSAAAGGWERLALDIRPQQAGFVELWVANESGQDVCGGGLPL